jgi:DMSO/TMAO reductase YedYZ molybdopterin-dependent catalytic subunit
MTEPRPQPTEVPARRFPLGRAAFLGTLLVGLGGIAALSRLGGGVGQRLAEIGAAMPGVNDMKALPGWRIYYVQDPMRSFDPATYTLTIDGDVERPVTLTWPEVAALPMVDQVCDFHCVTGWSVYDVAFRGVRAQTLLDLVGPRPGATQVTFQSLEDPYFDQLALDQFTQSDVMLATEMEGAPLLRPHGAPLRLVVPRMYGYKGVKWVTRITFGSEQMPGYWQQRGYDVDAWVEGDGGA